MEVRLYCRDAATLIRTNNHAFVFVNFGINSSHGPLFLYLNSDSLAVYKSKLKAHLYVYYCLQWTWFSAIPSEATVL